MDDSTRRGFLVTAGAGAAAVGVAAVAPSAQAAVGRHTGGAHSPAHARGPLVAHVADVHGDTVTLMVGERKVVVRDADLVSQLARAAWGV
jgi:hypothetical protein